MKATKSTLKSFIRKNTGNIYINIKSSFDGMIDGCAYYNDGFTKAVETKDFNENTLGINGVWLVGGSRNHFEAYNDGIYSGYRAFNCCGSFILATK